MSNEFDDFLASGSYSSNTTATSDTSSKIMMVLQVLDTTSMIQ